MLLNLFVNQILSILKSFPNQAWIQEMSHWLPCLPREQEKELYCLRSLSNDIGAEITEPLSGTAFVLAPEQQDHIISSLYTL